MSLRLILLFLVGMAVLAMFGKLRLPAKRAARRCPSCGRPKTGPGPCPCGAKS